MTRHRRSPILPVAPAPATGECVYGYVRRLAEANGFASLARAVSVFGLGRISPLDDPRRKADDPWQRLSWLTGLAASSFRDLRWLRAKNSFTGYESDLIVQGVRLRSGLVDVNAFKVCPDCLAETGILQTDWFLRYCVACLHHRTTLLEVCRICASSFGSPKKPHGRAPWACRCGSDLRTQRSDQAGDSAVRLAEHINVALRQIEVRATGAKSGGLDFGSMPLNDALMLVHVLGVAGTTSAEQDNAMRVGTPPFPFALGEPPASIRIASHRIEAAVALLDGWPGTFHSLLGHIAHRFPTSDDRRQDKGAFGSRIGKMLLYPPCELSGRPLKPIYDEVYEFCQGRLGLKLSKRRHHTLDGVARQIYPILNLSTVARVLQVSSNDNLLAQTFQRVVHAVTQTEQHLPPERLASLVEKRVLRLYRARTGSLSASSAAQMLEGAVHKTTLSGWDHPTLLTPLKQLEGLGKLRLRSYASEDVWGLLERLSMLARQIGAPTSMIRLRGEAMRRQLSVRYTKADLLLDIFAGTLPVHTMVEHPSLDDLWVYPDELPRREAELFIRQHIGAGHYMPWATLKKRLKAKYPTIMDIDQWTLQSMANQALVKRKRLDVDKRLYVYSLDDMLSHLSALVIPPLR